MSTPVNEDTTRDDKLRALLQTMVARIPAGKRITAGVVQQLLRAKYSADYPDDYVTSREAFITTTLEQLMQQRPVTTTTTAVTTSNAAAKHDTHSSSEEDEEDDEDSDDDDEEDSNASGEEDDDEEDDEEGEEEEEDEEEEDESTEVTSVEAASRKRAREEVEQAFDSRPTQQSDITTSDNTESLSTRCKAMVSCLQKLGYRPRLPEKDADLQEYLENYLKPEFVKRRLDPTRYSAQDIRRYKALKEVEQLQQDGAVLQLDRRQRVGRGYANVELKGKETNTAGNGAEESKNTAAPTKATYTTSKFLDDDDE